MNEILIFTYQAANVSPILVMATSIGSAVLILLSVAVIATL
jgi:hypothetical protein